MNRNIACDLNVIPAEERNLHKETSIKYLKSANEVKELSDGYAFSHPYSDEKFLSIAKWITNENKCCPFFLFELKIEPTEESHKIWLVLRGSKEIKQFLNSSEFLRDKITRTLS